jgi:hypothetical protein
MVNLRRKASLTGPYMGTLADMSEAALLKFRNPDFRLRRPQTAAIKNPKSEINHHSSFTNHKYKNNGQQDQIYRRVRHAADLFF